MLKSVNVKNLEKEFVKLQAELSILRHRFCREATASLKEATARLESYRCEDGGYTEHAAWMLGKTKRLEEILCNEGIHKFMDAVDELAYDEWAQYSHQWWSLGLAIENTEEKLRETKKALMLAKQNNQLEQAFKAAGFN